MQRRFTDIFIERPVLATVLSLLIFLIGLRSFGMLQIRQFPKITNTVISVSTAYPGASANLMQGFIADPLQKSIASAEGVDYLTSSSTQGTSTIDAHITLNYDPEKAFTNVLSKVSQVEGNLPQAAQKPVITKTTGSKTALMYLSYQSKKMTPNQVTNYISRVLQPLFVTVPGVAQAELLGGGYTYAMRIWLNSDKMAALGVSPAEVVSTLQANNFQSAAGSTKGEYTVIPVQAQTSLDSAKAFRALVIKHNKRGALVHLGDIARVELGNESYDGVATYNGKVATYVAITPTPTANPLTVITKVRALLNKMDRNFPPSLEQHIVFDATVFIRDSIHEVSSTIIEATAIVIAIIFLFLGSWRTVLIPIVTIPLSIVGVMTLMLMLGYSINLLTLLAMVLSIGLVVDDAIVVVENVHRHIEDGLSAFNAAIAGAREISMPIVSMTVTLAAVYAPIGFMQGLTGALFTEFAFTLACTVIISGVIALTLSPMMCSKVFAAEVSPSRYSIWLDAFMLQVRQRYQAVLKRVLDYRVIVLVLAVIVFLSCGAFYLLSQKQLAPQEDEGFLWMMGNGPQYANIDYTSTFSKPLNTIIPKLKGSDASFIINGAEGQNSVIGGVRLKQWSDRSQSQGELQGILQGEVSNIAGLQINVFQPPSLPTGGNMFPIDFVITSTGGFPALYQIATEMQQKAMASGHFMFLMNSLRFNKPQYIFDINRDKAAQMGISMQDIGNSLSGALSGNYINRFSMQDQSFKVIPQLQRAQRANPKDLLHVYVKNSTGNMLPLSNLVSVSSNVMPSALSQFQQLNSAELQGMMLPGQTTMTGLNYLINLARTDLAAGMSYDFSGQSRTTMKEGNKLAATFLFSLIVIFLVLSAQFESFTDPIVILISVPMSIFGALIPVFLGWFHATINIYTQIGMITLIGLISKHGILMVDFANHWREEKRCLAREAIEHAAGVRLRPILMTTAAMVMGVIPLLMATGAGAVSRANIGIVIAMGMIIGTCFTLFVVPTMYTYLSSAHKQRDTIVTA